MTNERLRWRVRLITWVILAGVIGWQGYVVTETQKTARESNERLFRIVHGAPVAVVMCNEQGHILEYNRAAEEMFGWTVKEVSGKAVGMLLAPESRAAHDHAFAMAVKKLREVTDDWKVTRRGMRGMGLNQDGKEFAVVFNTRGIRYGDKIEFLASIRRDVPEVKFESGPLELPKK